MADLNTQTPLARALHRKQELWNERSSHISHWRELSETQQPRGGRFFTSDVNKGGKRHNHIFDETATWALRTLAAGMMSGVTSPARPWFKLALPDKDLMEAGAVKTWLHQTAELMRAIFAASNTYRTLHTIYEELGLFGTGATVLLPNFDTVIHHYPMTVGEYAIANDEMGNVDTLVREFKMTVHQMVERFGLAAVSESVRNMHSMGKLHTWVDVVHLVEPRQQRDVTKADNKNMRFKSCYFEPAACGENKWLSESGFKRFPALCPRWSVTGNDVYGASPGMDVLGSVKQLQHQQLRKAQAIDYQVNPPIGVPTAMKNQAVNRLPGGVSYIDTAGTSKIESLFNVNLNLQHLREDILDVRDRIRTGYYADLFLMLANDTRSNVTATEVAQRHEEKLLMLGPVLERLHNELLSPMIDLAFDYCSRAGILPPPPPELQGMELNVEFISVLAQAQRAVAAQGMDRLLANVGQIAAASGNMAVWDKVDTDQAVEDYAEMFGVNPEIVIPDDQVANVRKQRAEAQQAQQSALAAAELPAAAKTASEIDTQNLEDVMQRLTGYSTTNEAAL
jgi:hypothetical protein